MERVQVSFQSVRRGFFLLALLSVHTVEAQQQICQDIFQVKAPVAALHKNDHVIPKAPPSSDKQIDERAGKAWSGSNAEKSKFFQEVHGEMYYLYPGLEAEIDKVMAEIKTRILFPKLVKTGGFIPSIGFSGYAKTDMVQMLARLLGSRFQQVGVVKGQVGIDRSVFHEMADLAPDQPGSPLGILLIDEFQNLRDEKQLIGHRIKEERVTTMVSSSVVSTKVDETAVRDEFIRTLVDVYGNGVERATTNSTAFSYIGKIKTSVETLLKIRLEMAKTLEEAGATPTEAQREMLTSQKGRMSRLELEIDVNIRDVLSEYGDRLTIYRHENRKKLAEDFIRDLESMSDSFMRLIGNAPVQRTYTYKKLITIATGNPDRTISKFRQKMKSVRPDADRNRELALAIDPAEIQKELFDDKLGESATGLRRRLGVDGWHLIPPFGSAQWAHFLDRQIEVMQTQFKESLADTGWSETSLKIDSSVRDLLNREGILPTDGPAIYFDRAKTLIGNFFGDLATRVIEAPEAQRPEELLWSYDPLTREFVVQGLKGGTVMFEERADVRRINQRGQVQLTPYDKKKAYAGLAGQIVAGMAMFRTVPMSFKVNADAVSEWSLSGLWHASPKAKYTSAVDTVRIALGMNSGQNLLSDGFTANLSEPSLQFSHDMLRRMVDELRRREVENDHLVSVGPDGKRNYDRIFPVPEGISEEVFAALSEAASTRDRINDPEQRAKAERLALNKALRLLHHDIHFVLEQNAELMSALMRLMELRMKQFDEGQIAAPEITSADILALVEKNKQFRARGIYRPSALNAVTGVIEPAKGFINRLKPSEPAVARVLITPEKLVPEPGVISERVHPMFLEHSVVMKRNMWSKVWNQFFKRPDVQRPLDPQ